MESLNQTLFLWLNAPAQPNDLLLTVAIFFAEQLIWAVPCLIGIGWLGGDEGIRKAMLVATVSGLFGLIINQLIGLAWSNPRPFMIGLGHTFLSHAADSSFPSDHLTLWWAVSLSLMLQRGPRTIGLGLTILGLPIAWARIYLGVHFPLDMLGAVTVAAFVAWLTLRASPWYLPPIFQLTSAIDQQIVGRANFRRPMSELSLRPRLMDIR
ncbi:undecaprenyl-diphosphatase [Pseudaeromonas pectinilytica]